MRIEDYERKHRAFLAAAQLRHPWQFRTGDGRAAGAAVDIGPGWHHLLNALFDDVAVVLRGERRRGFWWRRLHSDGGGLGIEHAGEAGDQLQGALQKAARRAAASCEDCGEPARRRQVAGRFATQCDLHYTARLVRRGSGDEMTARIWLTTPRTEYGGRSPRAALLEGAGERHAVLGDALRMALPPAPSLTLRQRRWLLGAWHAARTVFRERLQDMRVAGAGGGVGNGAPLLVVLSRPEEGTDVQVLDEALRDAGYSGLTPCVLSSQALRDPVAAPDPWRAMMARHAAVSVVPAQTG